jgi:hypothetical protein
LLFAFAAVAPSLYLGWRGRGWIWWPTILLSIFSVVNLLAYLHYTKRLKNLATLENAPNQSPDPTSGSVTPPAGQEPRQP